MPLLALDREIVEAVEAYKEGVLCDRRFEGGYRPFEKSDTAQVQMALALRGLDATKAQIDKVAERLGLT